MPKKHRIRKKNSMLGAGEGCMDYSEIGTEMTGRGFRMTHSLARGILISAMSKIAREVISTSSGKLSPEEINRVATNPTFQRGIMELLQRELS